MPRTWPLYEAKNKLTEVIEKAITSGPQTITRRGVEAAVVLSVDEFRRLTRPPESLREFFSRSPLKGTLQGLDRSAEPGRGTEIELPH